MASGGGPNPPSPDRAPFLLHDLLPPAHDAEAHPLSDALPPRLGAFGHLLDEVTPEVVGRTLGTGPAAEARWQHLAGDAAACEAIKTSVMLHHIVPLPEWKATADPVDRTRLANRLGGQFCSRVNRNALLVHGTPRWDVCVLLARHLAQREAEADDAYASRCRTYQAWAAARAFERAGILLLLLRQAAVLLSGVDLFEGMPGYSLAALPADALGAHLRVPSRLRPEGRLPVRLIDPGWQAPEVGGGGGGGEGGGGEGGGGEGGCVGEDGGGGDGDGGGEDGGGGGGEDGGGADDGAGAGGGEGGGTRMAGAPRVTDAVDVSAEAQEPAEVDQPNVGGAAARPSGQSVGDSTVAAADDGASDSARSAASTRAAASKGPTRAAGADDGASDAGRSADGDAWAAYQLAEAVRGIVYRQPEATLEEVCERLAALGLRASREQVEEERSRTKRARSARRAEVEVALDDAVEGYDGNMAVWMRAHGVSNPSAAEAARLRVLSDQLVEQRSRGDFDGAVATWLETRLGSGIRPTRNERNLAVRKMKAFFGEDSARQPGTGGSRAQAGRRGARRAR
jgi:hypothetical protein